MAESAAMRLHQALQELRPAGSWALQGLDVWHRDTTEWGLIDPPEDYALPPLLDFPAPFQRLALEAYREQYGRFLEPDQHYVLVWPARLNFWGSGSWYYQAPPECPDHAGFTSSCRACRDSQAPGNLVVDVLAQWHLSITVQTWRSWQGPDGQLRVEQVVDEDDDYGEQDEQWLLGSYNMDPTEVEYGPHRLSAERQVLQL